MRRMLTRVTAVALLGVFVLVSMRMGAVALDDENILIRGVTLRVAPADPADQLIRPRNAPVILTTRVEDGAGVDVTADALFADTVVRGHLSGNGIAQDVSAPLGANLEIGTTTESIGDLLVGPPLLEPGNYTLDDLRLVDSSGAVVLVASRSVAETDHRETESPC